MAGLTSTTSSGIVVCECKEIESGDLQNSGGNQCTRADIDGIEGLAIFVSDYMAPVVGNVEQTQPVGYREKSMISFVVDNVDDTYNALKEKGIVFINEPIDMPDWGMRVVHLRDPEENLIELYTPLAAQ